MNFNDSYTGLRADLLKHITLKDCTVLDAGCATGANGKWLLDSGIARSVVGIEYDPRMAEVARKHCTTVHNIDLNMHHALKEHVGEAQFDYILLGDVLEHLIDPWTTLELFSKMLRPGGRAILSIPNVGHIDTFIHVFLKGYWPYNDRGIFDKTHLRFFTLQNIKDMVHGAGLDLLEIERTFRHRDAIGSRFPFYGTIIKRLFMNLYTFQYIVICTPREALKA